MNEKYLLDAISDETLVRLIDETLTLEKNAKNKSIKKSLLKLIPAVAAIAIVIGFINQRGVVDMQSGAQSELVEGAIETETTISEEIEEFGETSDYIVINGKRIDIAETSLELDSSELTDADIEPLQYMVNLQSLRIISMTLQPGETYYKSGNISDISPLANLTDLVFLDLHANQIDDISALANLTNLTFLDLRYNAIYAEQIEHLREALPDAEIWADESDHVKDPIAAGDIDDILANNRSNPTYYR